MNDERQLGLFASVPGPPGRPAVEVPAVVYEEAPDLPIYTDADWAAFDARRAAGVEVPQLAPVAVVRVALVACGKTKRKHAAPAGELYTGALVKKELAYARATCDAVFILSARNGLTALDAMVEPYELELSGKSAEQRAEWGAFVLAQLRVNVPAGAELLLLAGRDYRDALPAELFERHPSYSVPLVGLGIGQQLAWLKAALEDLEEEAAPKGTGSDAAGF